MRVYRDKVLIHIDKKLQIAKRERTQSGLLRSPSYSYMLYNLQHGEVIQVGDKVKNILPETQPGDIAIFHHVVEEKPNTLVKYLPNMDELRVVFTSEFDMANQLYAVIKPDGTIIPAKHYVILNTLGLMMERKVVSSTLSLDIDFDTSSHYEQTIESNKKQIEQLHNTLTSVTDDRINKEEVSKRMQELYEENQVIGQKMRGPQLASFEVMAISDNSAKELNIQPGNRIVTRHELLTPLSIMDVQMMLCYKKYVSVILNN